MAAGLAQVSEFSFVLGSRARRFHLISREVRSLILNSAGSKIKKNYLAEVWELGS